MKLTVEQVPPIPSNYSDAEVAAHVRHYFPNLSGPLKTLLDRFEGHHDTINAVKQAQDNGDMEVSCPHCGTVIGLDLEVPE